MLRRLDLRLLRLLRTDGHGPAVERAVLAYSRAGEHAKLWYAVAAAGAVMDPRHRPVFARTAALVFATQVANSAIKLTIRRARPLLEDLPPLSPTVSSLAYPSAHAATSFAAAGSLSDRLPTVPLHAAAATMALTRPYLGVHYPSDVVAGAVLGAALARAAR